MSTSSWEDYPPAATQARPSAGRAEGERRRPEAESQTFSLAAEQTIHQHWNAVGESVAGGCSRASFRLTPGPESDLLGERRVTWCDEDGA